MIDGFLDEPLKTASGDVFTGRLTCAGVQWIGDGPEAFVTFTITAREILSAADSNLLWTDQDVQRGVKPEYPKAEKILSLSSGYPSEEYIFVESNADDMADKLLSGDKLFLSPLIWNLRPGNFEAYSDTEKSALYIYSGKIFLPDSHHRHQAIVKACRAYEEAPKDYPKFSLGKQFKIELYFLSRDDEGNYFFDKNQRTRQTANSKAFDLTTQDALSLLAKRVASKSTALESNVNRVTDRLTGKNPQVITLSALREMMKTVSIYDHMDDAELEGLATIAADFYDLLASFRPELAQLNATERKEIRARSLVDAGVMMQGYASLIKLYQKDISQIGSTNAERKWKDRLSRLSGDRIYSFENWSGDLFDKSNPFWQRVGILKPNKSRTGLSIVSNGATRSEAGRVLKSIVEPENPVQLADIVNP
jgi:hypothetical protein